MERLIDTPVRVKREVGTACHGSLDFPSSQNSPAGSRVRGLAAAAALVLALQTQGCSINDAFQDHVLVMDRSVDAIRNSLILTNIVRAKYNAPLSFTSVPTAHGSSMVGATIGLPTLTFGPGQTVQQGQYAFGPNSLASTTTASFDLAPLESKEFYTGLLTPLSLDTLHFFTQQGFPREILFQLAVERVIVGRGRDRTEWRNDPRSASLPEFLHRLRAALDLGLTTETVGKGSVRFCFDASLASKPIGRARPVCGVPGGGGLSLGDEVDFGKPLELEIELRSTQGIFYHLGHLIDAGPSEQAAGPEPGQTPDGEFTFQVERGPNAGACLARADYDGETYCVPLGRSRFSSLAIGFLAELLALNTSINQLPLTSTVRLTP